MEELTERIEEASGATQAQIELNKKRESEVLFRTAKYLGSFGYLTKHFRKLCYFISKRFLE